MGAPGTSPFLLPVGPGSTVGPLITGLPVQQLTNAPQSRSRKHPPVSLYIETRLGSNVFSPAERFDWRDITLGMDGGDTTATIVAGLEVHPKPL